MPVYGLSGTTYAAKVLESTDEGVTWAVRATISSGTANDHTEPVLAWLPDGSISCLVRAVDSVEIRTTVSTDLGVTWPSQTLAFAGSALPTHVRLPSGYWLYVSRANPNGDTIYRTRTDDDSTWSGETVLDATGTRNLYASIQIDDPTTTHAAYGIENSSTDGDIRVETFTDTSTGVTLHDELGRVYPDQHHAQDHAVRHEAGGADEVNVEELGTAETDTALALKPDGAGGLTFGSVAGAPTAAQIKALGRWEPVTFDSGSGPELVFSDGEIVVQWVDTP